MLSHRDAGLHAWQDRLIVSVNMTYPEHMIAALRNYRDSLHQSVVKYFEECQATPEPSYEHWFQRERRGGRIGIIEAVRDWREGKVTSSFGVDDFLLIQAVFRANGVGDAAFGPRVLEFLDSETFTESPASGIATRMWAVFGHKASNGQRQPPDRGTMNDINVVSTLLPYCDAMFIDNRCRALWTDIPKKYALKYQTEMFSTNTCEAFLDYVKNIEAAADPQILSDVREVYGDDWPTPFLTMYDVERKMERRPQES